MEDSNQFSLNMTDVIGLFKRAALVGSAAALTFVAGNLGGLDFGSLGILIVPIVAVALDSAIKWLKDNSNKPVDPPA
jgi:hypothetical protein